MGLSPVGRAVHGVNAGSPLISGDGVSREDDAGFAAAESGTGVAGADGLGLASLGGELMGMPGGMERTNGESTVWGMLEPNCAFRRRRRLLRDLGAESVGAIVSCWPGSIGLTFEFSAPLVL